MWRQLMKQVLIRTEASVLKQMCNIFIIWLKSAIKMDTLQVTK